MRISIASSDARGTREMLARRVVARAVRLVPSSGTRVLHRKPTARVTNRSFFSHAAAEVRARPIAYAMIPTVAAGVGLVTNWMGVKMMFAPIEYIALADVYREEGSPYGLIGWQGVVPARTEKMATRLTEIVTRDLLSLREAFSGIDPGRLASLLMPSVIEAIRRDAPHGEWWAWALRPFLWPVLRSVAVELKVDIEKVLELDQVVMSAFVRDKQVLVDLFQRVGRAELDFL